MSVQQILKAKEILSVVPDARKAQALRVTTMERASILRKHRTRLFSGQTFLRSVEPAKQTGTGSGGHHRIPVDMRPKWRTGILLTNRDRGRHDSFPC